MSNEVYGFRFLDTFQSSFYQLFAVGHQKIQEKSYDWDGLRRKDGPLYLFQYTVSGFGDIDINGKVHRVEPGSAFMVEIPSTHRYYLPTDSEEWEFYFILFRPRKIEQEWQEVVKMLGRIPRIQEDSSPIHFLKSTYLAAVKNQITDGFRASSIVYQFVMELYRYGKGYEQVAERWPEKITLAARILTEEYHSLQSLEEIAARVQLSKYHFSRLFKKTQEFHRWSLSQRCEWKKQLPSCERPIIRSRKLPNKLDMQAVVILLRCFILGLDSHQVSFVLGRICCS